MNDTIIQFGAGVSLATLVIVGVALLVLWLARRQARVERKAREEDRANAERDRIRRERLVMEGYVDGANEASLRAAIDRKWRAEQAAAQLRASATIAKMAHERAAGLANSKPLVKLAPAAPTPAPTPAYEYENRNAQRRDSGDGLQDAIMGAAVGAAIGSLFNNDDRPSASCSAPAFESGGGGEWGGGGADASYAPSDPPSDSSSSTGGGSDD